MSEFNAWERGDEEHPRNMLDGPVNIGRSETVVSPALGIPAPVVTLADLKSDDPAARMITIHLGTPTLENIDDTSKPDPIPGVALLEWGSGGHQHQAEVDFGMGCTLSLCASYLRVKATLDRQVNGGVSLTPVRLAATTGYHTRPGLAEPTRTIYTAGPAVIPPAGISGFLRIPNFARRITLQARVVTAIPLAIHRLIFTDLTGTQLAEYAGTILDLRDIPFPNGASQWRVVNGEAIGTEFIGVWTLAL